MPPDGYATFAGWRDATQRYQATLVRRHIECDFHLPVFLDEELEIGLTSPPTGITQIRLRLLGANPDVLDGQPFDLNINVETDAAPLLEALAESRRLQQGVTERLWRLVR